MGPYAYPNHNLFDHLEGTEKIALRTINNMGKDVVCKRFKKFGLEMDGKLLEEAVRVAALLHDIGKADDRYQRDAELQSFYLHEVPSAVISYRVCEALKIEAIKEVVFMAVLQHMYAIRDWLSQIHTTNIRISRWSFDNYGAIVKEFINKHLNVDVDICVSNTDFMTYYSILRNKIISYSTNGEALKLYILILAPLTVGDNLDAYKFRAGNLTEGRRWFVEELMNLEED